MILDLGIKGFNLEGAQALWWWRSELNELQ